MLDLLNIIRRKYLKYCVVIAVIFFYVVADSLRIDGSMFDFSVFYKINLFFWGIFIQSFPFILTGALISSAIRLFIGREGLGIFMGKSGIASSILPLIASFVLPTCDCSSVTVAAGFVKKNFPLRAIVIYLLAAPILNPIVIISTMAAFPGRPDMVILRILLGISVAVISGNVLHRLFGASPSLYVTEKYSVQVCGCGHCHDEDLHTRTFSGRLRLFFTDAGDELFHVLPFVILGAMLSSVFQAFVPKEIITGGNYTGILFQAGIMLITAFILSLCSTSDAFIARSFSSHFGYGPVLGFMVFGPMLDVKNFIVLLSYFKKRFVIVLSLLAFFITYLSVMFISYIMKGF